MVSQTLWMGSTISLQKKNKKEKTNHETDKPEERIEYPWQTYLFLKREVTVESSLKTCFLVEKFLQNSNFLGIRQRHIRRLQTYPSTYCLSIFLSFAKLMTMPMICRISRRDLSRQILPVLFITNTSEVVKIFQFDLCWFYFVFEFWLYSLLFLN